MLNSFSQKCLKRADPPKLDLSPTKVLKDDVSMLELGAGSNWCFGSEGEGN